MKHIFSINKNETAKVLTEFQAMKSSIEDTTTKAELTKLTKDWKVYQNAIADLMTTASAAHVRAKGAISKAKDQLNESTKQELDDKTAQAGQAAKRRRGANTAANIGVMSFRSSIKKSQAIPTFAASPDCGVLGDNLNQVDSDKPAIVRFDAVVTSEGPLKDEVDAWRDAFAQSSERASAGRSHRSIVTKNGKVAESLLRRAVSPNPLVRGACVSPDAYQGHPVSEDMEPVFFAVMKDKEGRAMEAGQFSSVRLIFHGIREVYCLPGLGLLKYLAAHSENKAMPPVKTGFQWLANATQEQVEEFLDWDEDCVMYHGTQGPQDALYLPAGWIWGERVKSGHDLIGVRVILAWPKDLSLHDKFISYFTSLRKPNQSTQRMVDFLTLHESKVA